MATISLVELNHDCWDKMRSSDFIEALRRYLANPDSKYNAEALADFGVMVRGSCHADDRSTRGFRVPGSIYWAKVITSDVPFSQPARPTDSPADSAFTDRFKGFIADAIAKAPEDRTPTEQAAIKRAIGRW